MIAAASRPMPKGNSPYAGVKLNIGFEIPDLKTVVAFLGISGPVLGVIVVKCVVFGMISSRAAEMGQATAAAHQILFSLALFFGVFGYEQ